MTWDTLPCPVCGRINWVTNTDADSDTVALASICVNCWYLRTCRRRCQNATGIGSVVTSDRP